MPAQEGMAIHGVCRSIFLSQGKYIDRLSELKATSKKLLLWRRAERFGWSARVVRGEATRAGLLGGADAALQENGCVTFPFPSKQERPGTPKRPAISTEGIPLVRKNLSEGFFFTFL